MEKIFFKLRKAKNCLIATSIIFVVATIVGLFIYNKLHSTRLIKYILDYNFIFSYQEGIGGYILNKLFTSILLLLIVCLFSISVYTIPLNFLIITYSGIIFSSLFLSCITTYSILGVVLFILLILPFHILRSFAIILLTGIRLNEIIENKNRKNCDLHDILANFTIAVLIVLIAIIWEIIILNMIIIPLNCI